MTKLKTALLAATVLALPLALQAPAAQAQPVNGMYVGAGAGVNWLQGQDVTASQPLEFCGYGCADGSVSGRWGTKNRLGFAGVASIGWGFGNGLRAEIEGSWRANSLSGKSFAGSLLSDDSSEPGAALSNIYGSSRIRGRSDQYAVMVNALYDMDIGANWIYPYIGAGVGYSWQRFDSLGAEGGGNTPGFSGSGIDGQTGVRWSRIRLNSNDTVGRFAYQAIAGAAFPIAAVPGLSFTAEYRFMGTVGTPDLDGRVRGGGNIRFDGRDGDWNSGGKAKVDEAYNHSILLGLRYAFNAAPAAVVAAPPKVMPAAKSFLVFFDWDRSTLTDRARGIIKEAAQTSKTTQHTRLEVNGYADTSGNPKYNQGLSMRRAQTVAAELVRNGVPKQEIAIKAFGDTVLLVPTGPGVREPQNRRVEIIIR